MIDTDLLLKLNLASEDLLGPLERKALAERLTQDPELLAEVRADRRLGVLIYAAALSHEDRRTPERVMAALSQSRVLRLKTAVRQRTASVSWQERILGQRTSRIWRWAALLVASLLLGIFAYQSWSKTSIPTSGPVQGLVTWADGSRVILAPGSKAQQLPAGQGAQLELTQGSLDAEIAPQTAQRPFVIVTPQGSATVLGTRFRLETASECTWLAVREGRVRLAGNNSQVEISASNSGILTSTGPAQILTPWHDKRPIGAWFLAHGQVSATNPKGWFHDPNFNVIGSGGQARFEQRLFAEAERMKERLLRIRAQGLILWSLEGSSDRAPLFPGDPRLISELAPEMETVSNRLFAMFHQAGLSIGVRICMHPFTRSADGRLLLRPDDDAMLNEATARIAYARQRWGCKLFFLGHDLNAAGIAAVDRGETPDPDRHAVAASVLAHLRQRFPECLFISEHLNAAGSMITPGFLNVDAGAMARLQGLRQAWPMAQAFVYITPSDLSQRRNLITNLLATGALPLVRLDNAEDPALTPLFGGSP